MKSKFILCLLTSCFLTGGISAHKVEAAGSLELNFCESQTDLNTMMLLSKSSSRLSLSNEKKTQGNYSAKLEIVSAAHYSTQTTLYQSLRHVAKDIDYTDINAHSIFKFSVYNDNDTVKTISVSCISRNTFQHGQDMHQTKTISLPSKTWTDVTYQMDKSDASIPLVNGTKYISGVDIVFSKALSTAVNDVYYIDNITIE